MMILMSHDIQMAGTVAVEVIVLERWNYKEKNKCKQSNLGV